MKKRQVVVVIIIAIFLLGFIGLTLTWYVPTGFAIFNFADVLNLVGQVFINILFQLKVDSPLNVTYNFNDSNDYNISLEVSSVKNINTWWYTLINADEGVIVNDSIIFTPNTTIIGVRGNNRLVIFANDSINNIKNISIFFFINGTNSAPIIEYMNSSIYSCEGGYLSYFFNVTDMEGDTITPSLVPQYPVNPFFIQYLSYFNSTLSKHEIFSGVLTKADVGGVNNGFTTYPAVVYVSDNEFVDSAATNITVIEINNAPVIETMGVYTIWTQGDNSTFYYEANIDDAEDGDENSGNLSFNLSFSGNSLFNISSNGIINYTSNGSYVGVHNISLCASDRGLENPFEDIIFCSQDGSSLTSCEAFSLTITNENRAPDITSYFPVNLSINASGNTLLEFNVSEYDADGTIPDVYWYVDGAVSEYDSGSLTDKFSYSFGCSVSGNHIIKAVATDGALTDFVQWNISVSLITCPAGETGGGGGGGGARLECVEKWACEPWSECIRLKNADLGNLSYEINLLVKERCSLKSWNDDNCGFQIKNCTDLNRCGTNLTKSKFIKECQYSEIPTCSDEIKNCHEGLCEVLTDCGGPCSACPTCSDKIKNQGEEGIDCGGPCPICLEIPFKDYIKRFSISFFLILFFIGIIFIILLIIKYYKKQKRVSDILKKKKRL